MKVLILNGSPHKNGDTAFILAKIKERIPKNVYIEEIIAYNENIHPCIDCRYCWKKEGCSINDRMTDIWEDDYDVIIVASPVYMFNLTPPLFSIVTRLNMKWCNNYFLGKDIALKKKKGILVLTGGGVGAPNHAIDSAKLIFEFLNADFDVEKDYIYSLNTNNIPASKDSNILLQIEKTINHIFK